MKWLQPGTRIETRKTDKGRAISRRKDRQAVIKALSKTEKWRIVMLNNEEGKIGWILLWALGVPVPILVIVYLLRGCT